MNIVQTRTAMVRAAPRAIRASILALALTGALAGCISIGTKPPDQLFRLTATEAAPVGDTSSGVITEAVVVLDPEAERALDVLRVPVNLDASRVAYLKDALWVERPTRQFRSLLAETLRSRTKRLVVEGGDFEVTGRTLIGGRLLQMGYDAQRRAVVVRFDAIRTERGGEITSHRFESVVNGIAPKAGAVGPALNQAANDVARQVADWVKP